MYYKDVRFVAYGPKMNQSILIPSKIRSHSLKLLIYLLEFSLELTISICLNLIFMGKS